MERGSAKDGARQDDALAAAPQPLPDDGPPARRDPACDAAASDDPDPALADPDDAELYRIQHDMAVANDWNPGPDAGRRG